MPSKQERKGAYLVKAGQLFDTYDKILVVEIDNVGSKQLQDARRELRSLDSIVLCGKNTVIRKALKDRVAKKPPLEKILHALRGNVSFVFTRGDLREVRDCILRNKVPAPAKAGQIAQCDVFVPAGPTGMPPDLTSFFQALSIPTKIERGSICIVSDVQVIKQNERVSASAVALLQRMGIEPFTYGMKIRQIYEEGAMYEPSVLDITPDDLRNKVREAVDTMAAISLATGYLTAAAVPHILMRATRNVIAASIAADYDMPQSHALRELLSDPSKLEELVAAAAVTTGAAGAASTGGATSSAPTEAAKNEPAEESDEDLGFGLFD
ncbi:hypothetical protein CCYA_CCYA05G1458 [Cyanidiococcus yangmingshanensis]|uniref:60S acidic ribosomal protein P0 n=1 Tax=Cyanidiococcus yangmingshanensis TaxID=2690220 RepID=A0A7J7IMP0_9RHOD|nr:60S acidic ribosomal protein [Cyanidiococcus yangmingshanensis]KAK4530601.1 hypothetical protein CCYA_CCYA05G1458 [Cyanidiococcus yangmingshanensis]